MSVRRNRFPDYFGTARSIEPVAGRRRRGLQEKESADLEPADLEPEQEYAAQASQAARSAFQPNQWASSGTQARTSRSSAQGLENLRQFAYGGPQAQAEQSPAAHRPQTRNIRNTKDTFGQVSTPRRPPARPPPTPYSNQPGASINWSRRPDGGFYGGGGEVQNADEDEDGNEYEAFARPQPVLMPMKSRGAQSARRQTSRAGPTYEIMHRPLRETQPGATLTSRNDQYARPLPPTPRNSSPPPPSAARSLIRPVHRPAPRVSGIDLISPRTSLDPRFHGIFPYEHFNAMQSSCFSCVSGSSDNVVVAAPTGSGKTVVFELAICRLLAQRDRENKDFKIVYQAPTKALCSERARDWQAKFSRSSLVSALGKLQVAEFTGDSSAFEVRRVRTASIIVTTPEKWDSITRKWSDHANTSLLRSVKLVLIDEVHVLKDARGATLETVVSRMKTLGDDVRFVALSATIPNAADIAQWLGRTHTMPQIPARTFVFGEEFRPVHLQKIVLGFNVGGGGGGMNSNGGGGSSEHTLDNMLDDQIPDLVVKHAQGKPVLIFCFSRKSTESAATALTEFWSRCPPDQRPWPAPTVNMRASATKLQATVDAGVAFHHGGLERQDREMIEDAFLKGHIFIICCTSTLAVGVNLPCHTVILKGTMGYQGGKLAEYDEFEMMQMIGRAGRPQFDTSATAIILTRAENRDKYLNLESGRQVVESTLHLNLIEHLNSEIVLGTITSLNTAIHWLKGTFLAVRLRENPGHYGQITDAATNIRTTEQQLEEICKVGITRLAEVGLLKYVDGDGDNKERTSDSKFHGTEYGSAMSTYMVRFDTMVQIVGFAQRMTLEELLNALCHASEFDDLRIKSTERPVLRELNLSEADNIPFRFSDNITETWQKISLLIQVELSRGTLPYQHGRFSFEARRAMEHMQRLLESYIMCTIDDGNGHNTRIALELARSISARAWEGDRHPAQLCQVPDIGPVNMRKLVDKKVTTVRQLAELGSVAIERLLSKNPPAAMKIADALRGFPKLAMEGQVSRCPGDQAVAQVTVGFANEGGLPRWRNRVPSLTFLAETAEGTLLHIWRGKLQANRQEHEMTFAVPLCDAEAVNCYIACDEIVGTLVSAQLSCVDIPQGDMRAIARCVKPVRPAKSAQRNQSNQHADADNPAKRQKLQHESSAQPLPRSMQTLAVLPSDSFAFQSSAVRQPKNCSGGGTQHDPFTLDSGSDLDDFDTDIFDDLELPAVEAPSLASVKPPTARSDKENQPLGEMMRERSPLAVKDTMAPPAEKNTKKTRELRTAAPKLKPRPKVPSVGRKSPSPVRAKFSIPSIFATALWDSSSAEEDGEHPGEQPVVEPLVIPGTPDCETTDVVDAHVRAVGETNSRGGDAIPINTQDDGGAEHKKAQGQGQATGVCDPIAAETPAPKPATPSEPAWVSAAANSSVIDFLRGHVRFV